MLAAWSLPVPGRDPAAVRAMARRITGGAEFGSRRRSIPAAAWHWLSEHVGRWLNHLLGFGSASGNAAWVAVGLAVIAAVVVARALWETRRFARRRAHHHTESGVVVTDLGPARSSATWLREAEEAETAGRWRDAVRCRYGALVASLGERGVVDLRAGRTSGEYRREVMTRAPDVAAPMGAATAAFEECWYGEVAASEDTCARLRGWSAAVLTSVPVARQLTISGAGPAA